MCLSKMEASVDEMQKQLQRDEDEPSWTFFSCLSIQYPAM